MLKKHYFICNPKNLLVLTLLTENPYSDFKHKEKYKTTPEALQTGSRPSEPRQLIFAPTY